MLNMTPNNEKELMLLVSEGNEKAFKELFEFYGKLLFPFLFNVVKSAAIAEELIQEVMLRIWIHRDKLPEIEVPRKWVFRIASNLAFTFLQRRLKEHQIIGSLRNTETNESDLEAELRVNEIKRHVQEAVKQLPKERKRIYLLSREAGMSREEIAAQLGISPSTVKNSIATALKFIREYLEKMGYGELIVIYFLMRF